MRKKILIIAICAAVLIAGAFLSRKLIPGKSDMLLFVVGGDLESESGAATQDIKEIIRASQEYADKSCAVYLCGSEKWELSGLEDGHAYIIRIRAGEYKILRDLDKRAGTTAADLSGLLKYGKKDCDLVFWGHGGSGAAGVGVDLLNDNDTLTLYEIKTALDKAGKHFRVIGFDACNMATLQTAWVVSPYCELFCASIQDEELSGWHYRSVIRTLAEEPELTAELLRGAFREDGMTVLSSQQLISCSQQLCTALNAANSRDTTLLSEILPIDGELMLTNWENGELPTQELMPELADIYRAFLTRR